MLEIIQTLTPLLSGPAAAALVLLLTLGALYQFLSKKLLPMFERILTLRDREFETLLESHEKDRAAFLKSMEMLDKRLDSLSSEFRTMHKEVAVVSGTVKQLRKDVLKCVTHTKEIEE